MPRTGLTSEELLEKALKIAMKNIRQNGFEKFRLIDVARELKVSHAALYNHFPDKGAVLDLISERWLQQIDDTLDKITEQDLPPCQKIAVWFQEFHRLKLEKVRVDPELFKSFNMAVELNKPFVLQHLKHMRDQLLKMVQQAIDSGELETPSIKAAVEILFESTEAFHHPLLVLEHKDEERKELLQRTVEVVLAGLPALD